MVGSATVPGAPSTACDRQQAGADDSAAEQKQFLPGDYPSNLADCPLFEILSNLVSSVSSVLRVGCLTQSGRCTACPIREEPLGSGASPA